MKKTLDILSIGLAAASDPIRLRLLACLEAHELTVGEIASVVQLPQSTVSRHLKQLSEAGWLSRRNEGTASLYRLVPDDQPRFNRDLWVTIRSQLDPDALHEDLRRAGAAITQRRTDSQTFFGRIGGDWDRVREELFGVKFTGAALLSMIDPDWEVADFGCGAGNVAEQLAPHVRRVHAVDSSDTMLEVARKRLAAHRNVNFVQGDATKSKLKTASCHAAVAMLLLHHVDDPAAVLREMKRVLKPDGVCVIVDMMPHDREEYRRLMGHRMQGISETAMMKLMRDAGWRRCVYSPIAHEPGTKGPGLFVASARG
ncbi:MAG: ArsR/SmtB family transcription factor [Phycisphaerales bacterium]|jgi:ubiquinone/menaquinone biosynthesis C-methylase UbiE/DNA-binding transcriptional ArsR family regulator